MKLKWLTNAFLLLLNSIVLVILLVINYVSVLSPDSVWSVLAPTNILFTAFVSINLLFVLWWIIHLKWYAIFSVLALLLCYINISNTFIIWSEKPFPEENKPIYSVVSYNIHHFKFFPKEKETKTGNHILDYLVELDADIICLQEFAYSDYEPFTLSDIKNQLSDYPYNHIEILYKDRHISKGIATFSKHKITNKQHISIPAEYHGAISSDVLLDGKKIRIINFHFESNRLTSKDKDIKRLTDRNKIPSFAKRLQSKLHTASRKRGKQADALMTFATNSSMPTIICGDMNDVPSSYTYRTITQHYTDNFKQVGKGFGNTFHENFYRYRIDYTFTNKQINPLKIKTHPYDISDHFPLQLDFQTP